VQKSGIGVKKRIVGLGEESRRKNTILSKRRGFNTLRGVRERSERGFCIQARSKEKNARLFNVGGGSSTRRTIRGGRRWARPTEPKEPRKKKKYLWGGNITQQRGQVEVEKRKALVHGRCEERKRYLEKKSKRLAEFSGQESKVVWWKTPGKHGAELSRHETLGGRIMGN